MRHIFRWYWVLRSVVHVCRCDMCGDSIERKRRMEYLCPQGYWLIDNGVEAMLRHNAFTVDRFEDR